MFSAGPKMAMHRAEAITTSASHRRRAARLPDRLLSPCEICRSAVSQRSAIAVRLQRRSVDRHTGRRMPAVCSVQPTQAALDGINLTSPATSIEKPDGVAPAERSREKCRVLTYWPLVAYWPREGDMKPPQRVHTSLPGYGYQRRHFHPMPAPIPPTTRMASPYHTNTNAAPSFLQATA